MGEVIAFRACAKTKRNFTGPRSGEAQILFFLGVRYMRMEDAQASTAGVTPEHRDTPRGGRRRKSRARA